MIVLASMIYSMLENLLHNNIKYTLNNHLWGTISETPKCEKKKKKKKAIGHFDSRNNVLTIKK